MIRKAWVAFLLISPLSLCLAGTAESGEDGGTLGEHSVSEGPVYVVGSIALEYAEPHPAHPSLEELHRIGFALGRASDGYVGPRRGGQNVWFTLPEIAEGPAARIYGSGLRELDEQIVAELNRRGVVGVFVAPHEEDIDSATGLDLRRADQKALRLVIYTGRVEGLRTFASGPGSGSRSEDRADTPRHQGIRSHSPIQPVGAGGRERADPLLRGELDDYVAYLNRHPGRRIDVAFTPGRRPGGIYLDYLVAEAKPWSLYSQISDTGTDRTTRWRQRFGFSHSQLTGRDDILRVDYVTGEFDRVNAYHVSYEAVVPYLDRTRWRVHAGSSDYEADVKGFPDGAFEGSVWSAGAGITRNVHQDGDLFIDAELGFRWLDIESDHLGFKGAERFFLPHLGLRADLVRDTRSLHASLRIERNVSAVAGTSSDEADLFALGGRVDVAPDFMLLTWNARYSMYLEPWLRPLAWRNTRTPSSSTLAHELSVATRGQYAFGTRLIPQQQQSLGGLHSIRGYPQATYTADSFLLVSTEYRFHWPRTFALDPRPRSLPLIGSFRVAPQRVYGRPDWDLILLGFFDLARGFPSDARPAELRQTLASVGVGVEWVLRRNLSLRLDYGVALEEVRDVDAGDGEAHVSATVRY